MFTANGHLSDTAKKRGKELADAISEATPDGYNGIVIAKECVNPLDRKSRFHCDIYKKTPNDKSDLMLLYAYNLSKKPRDDFEISYIADIIGKNAILEIVASENDC